MTDKETQATSAEGNMKKDPDTWVTGEEPMTGAQRSYLKTLSEEAKEPFDDTLTKAQASRRIDELQAATGRHPPDKDQASGGQGGGGTSDEGSSKGSGDQRESSAEQDARGEK
jgi:hypothetical protein